MVNNWDTIYDGAGPNVSQKWTHFDYMAGRKAKSLEPFCVLSVSETVFLCGTWATWDGQEYPELFTKKGRGWDHKPMPWTRS
jgi:hypothetical protein